MSIYKEHKVIILPTKNNKWEGNPKHIRQYPNGFTYYWNLYFLSDDEIKEGDWVYDEIAQIVEKALFNQNELKTNFKKIIATTDKSLTVTVSVQDDKNALSYQTDKYLPQIPQDFIKDYCEKGGIDEVLVEYERYVGERSLRVAVDPTTFYDGSPIDERVKISSDNTITIKPIKDSFTREEVIELLTNTKGLTVQAWDKEGFTISTEKWIKENL